MDGNPKVHYVMPHSDGTMVINLANGKLITAPDDAPLLDPYDRKQGKGFMLPNTILKSNLSANAKLAFCVLRSHICFNLGFVFVTQETIAKGMSKDERVVRKSTKELESCGIIRIVKGRWRNHHKLYFYFLPESDWKLPSDEVKEGVISQSNYSTNTSSHPNIENSFDVEEVFKNDFSDFEPDVPPPIIAPGVPLRGKCGCGNSHNGGWR